MKKHLRRIDREGLKNRGLFEIFFNIIIESSNFMIFILLILKYQKKFFVSVIRIKAVITKSNFEQLIFCLVDNESTIYAV